MFLEKPEIELTNYTPDPEKEIVNAFSETHQNQPRIKVAQKYIPKNHTSPLEHAVYSFKIRISRACWAQVQEHRLTSHTAESHRYHEPREFDFILPPEIAKNSEAVQAFKEHCQASQDLYKQMRSMGLKKEDARSVLPVHVCISVKWTLNLRELLTSFWRDRLYPYGHGSQWEIAQMAESSWEQVSVTVPNLIEPMNLWLKRYTQTWKD